MEEEKTFQCHHQCIASDCLEDPAFFIKGSGVRTSTWCKTHFDACCKSLPDTVTVLAVTSANYDTTKKRMTTQDQFDEAARMNNLRKKWMQKS